MEYFDTLKEEESSYVNSLIETLDPISSYPINYSIQDTIKYLKNVLSYTNSAQNNTNASNTTRLQLIWYVDSKQIQPEELTHVLKGEELLIADEIETHIEPSSSIIEDVIFSKNKMYMDIITKKNTTININKPNKPNNPYKYITFDNRTVIVEFRKYLVL